MKSRRVPGVISDDLYDVPGEHHRGPRDAGKFAVIVSSVIVMAIVAALPRQRGGLTPCWAQSHRGE